MPFQGIACATGMPRGFVVGRSSVCATSVVEGCVMASILAWLSASCRCFVASWLSASLMFT